MKHAVTLRPGDILARGAIIRHLEDLDEARELHKLAFEGDEWVGDDHEFWVALDGLGVVGFASAIVWDESYIGGEPNACFLSRAAVVKSASGMGLHKALIDARVTWAQREGVRRCVTYTTLRNYTSMVNLLQSGFRFYRPKPCWAGTHVHYYEKVCTHGK